MTPASHPLHITPPDPLMTTQEAATWMGVVPKTLKEWRRKKIGPSFVRLGHRTVRYTRASLVAWTLAREEAAQ